MDLRPSFRRLSILRLILGLFAAKEVRSLGPPSFGLRGGKLSGVQTFSATHKAAEFSRTLRYVSFTTVRSPNVSIVSELFKRSRPGQTSDNDYRSNGVEMTMFKEWILIFLLIKCLSAAPDKYYSYDLLAKRGGNLFHFFRFD